MAQALEKNGPQAIRKSRGLLEHRDSHCCHGCSNGLTFFQSPGHDHDAPTNGLYWNGWGFIPAVLPMLMDRAYEGNQTRAAGAKSGTDRAHDRHGATKTLTITGNCARTRFSVFSQDAKIGMSHWPARAG